MKSIPGNNVPSADTTLHGIKELRTSNTTFTSKQYNHYEFNINRKLNVLNIKLLLLTNQLQQGACYDFDYDKQVIATGKYDTKNTNKRTKGYFPEVASIGDKIIYVINRDGNANVNFVQVATLTRAYNLVKNNNISVNRSRMDTGSYSKDIIEVIASNSGLFQIRANKSAELFK